MPGQPRCRKRRGSSQSRGSRKNVVRASVDSVAWSGISCECEQGSAHRRCSASPQPPPRQDKENQQDMDIQDCSKHFSDDDSNQILPVEHFFGNMDTVQDIPPRLSAPSTTASRAQRRRRYFALEDSEAEEVRGEAEKVRGEAKEVFGLSRVLSDLH
ncbi:UPF0688 protein C1orf174 homolog [Eucyclogobius newberryi]|uniref:UPF0688 protein C1orf174 homolog n=1 Tax=Eucyclogobius newberryi TaxID=166745 RepID=UPI003B5B90E3